MRTHARTRKGAKRHELFARIPGLGPTPETQIQTLLGRRSKGEHSSACVVGRAWLVELAYFPARSCVCCAAASSCVRMRACARTRTNVRADTRRARLASSWKADGRAAHANLPNRYQIVTYQRTRPHVHLPRARAIERAEPFRNSRAERFRNSLPHSAVPLLPSRHLSARSILRPSSIHLEADAGSPACLKMRALKRYKSRQVGVCVIAASMCFNADAVSPQQSAC
eukprot:4490508-Pleurochrysis_carterae.AAC.1